jgi:hypothetical protein
MRYFWLFLAEMNRALFWTAIRHHRDEQADYYFGKEAEYTAKFKNYRRGH